MGTFNSNLSIDTIHEQLTQRINSIDKSLNIVRLEAESAEFKITYHKGGLVLKVKLFKRDDCIIVDYEHISVNVMGMEINTSSKLRVLQEKFAAILFRGVKENTSDQTSNELERFIRDYKEIEKGAESNAIRIVFLILGGLFLMLIAARIGASL